MRLAIAVASTGPLGFGASCRLSLLAGQIVAAVRTAGFACWLFSAVQYWHQSHVTPGVVHVHVFGCTKMRLCRQTWLAGAAARTHCLIQSRKSTEQLAVLELRMPSLAQEPALPSLFGISVAFQHQSAAAFRLCRLVRQILAYAA